MGRIKFLNTEVDNLTMDEAVQRVNELVQLGRPSYVVTPNMDHICLLERDEEFAEVYKNADLILTDGKPLIWISKLRKQPIKQKISGSDFFPKVCEMAAKEGYRIYILGAAEGVADKAARNLKSRFHNLSIVGTYSPSYGFEKDKKEIVKIMNMVRKAKPDILAVSLGSPKGEKFIYKYLTDMNVPVSMSIGATIDFEAGNVKRAPKWMSEHGLEWLFRISQDPKRMIQRYARDAKEIIPIMMRYK